MVRDAAGRAQVAAPAADDDIATRRLALDAAAEAAGNATSPEVAAGLAKLIARGRGTQGSTVGDGVARPVRCPDETPQDVARSIRDGTYTPPGRGGTKPGRVTPPVRHPVRRGPPHGSPLRTLSRPSRGHHAAASRSRVALARQVRSAGTMTTTGVVRASAAPSTSASSAVLLPGRWAPGRAPRLVSKAQVGSTHDLRERLLAGR